MSRDWEQTFQTWSTGPGTTEQTKLENAEAAVKKAISASSVLGSRDIRVFVKGSYANRTNVKRESDVDVCVLDRDTFFTYYPDSTTTDSDVGLVTRDYSFGDFKSEVGDALVDYFGSVAVRRGNKVFDVHENTNRVEADVVPSFVYRRYTSGEPGAFIQPVGTAFLPDNAFQWVTNWPDQQYTNGVAKNDRTRGRYKAITRAIKNLRNEMDDAGVTAAARIPSYLVECIVYRTPDENLGNVAYADDVRNVISYVWTGTATDEACTDWLEVNDVKYLFRPQQPWTREQVRDFLLAAWQYVGFE